MQRLLLALIMSCGVVDAASAASSLTPLLAPSDADQQAGISEWLPASLSADEIRRLIESDKPLAVLKAGDLGDFSNSLSAGSLLLLKKYPGYHLVVYPSRRSVSFPNQIYAASVMNSAKATLVSPDVIEGVTLGFPFLKPNGGLQAIWNHRLRYRGNSSDIRSTLELVNSDGSGLTIRQRKVQLNEYANLTMAASEPMLYYNYRAQAGSRYGDKYLILQHEPLEASPRTRKTWIRQPWGQMRRIGDIPTDAGTTPSEGVESTDMVDMFGGFNDFAEYTWKLLGRRPMIVPYNAYALADGADSRSDLLTKLYPNPDLLRYELHRVWVVEADLLPNAPSDFRKRIFYFDEDSWNILLAESYDDRGHLARFQECNLVQDFDHDFPECRPVVVHDFTQDRYVVDDLISDPSARQINVSGLSPNKFSPSAVRAVRNP